MSEEEKDDSANKKASTTCFALSLLCTLPFIALWILFVVWYLWRPQFLDSLGWLLLFGWPILALIGVVGLVSIVCTLFQHPKLYLLMILCALAIIGFMALWYYGITHIMGPM